jgi:hypothetical protein
MAKTATKIEKANADPMTRVLGSFERRDTQDWDNAWVGIEPTFQSKKSIKKWQSLAAEGKTGEDAYFEDDYMLGTQRDIAKMIVKKYNARRRDGGDPICMFDRVDAKEELDQWGVCRQSLVFRWEDEELDSWKARFTIDPETFEWSIKPVPLAWFYDERFVAFLEEFMWRIPMKHGISSTIAHGGAQFSFSAKTFLTGSVLADDIATRLNHPELSLWIMDWPNPDDRAFRATGPRFDAFRQVLKEYWAGAYHARALGVLTPENCYTDRGFSPAADPAGNLMNQKGPTGDAREVFQTNFAFGRAVRLRAQNVHPGYWQAAHPKEEGYRPDQIMRYSEGNLNRLQIAGEHHVKSGKVLDTENIPRMDKPLEIGMLYKEASWEDRGQMGRTSARDFVEALLLDVHAARWLQKNPRVKVKDSILQDRLLKDGEETLKKHAPRELSKLKKEAESWNAEASSGRLKSDWLEPETLMWSAWNALPAGDKGEIAHEIVSGFLERVENGASCDPRPHAKTSDPMEWHRHRVHPTLWKALEGWKGLKKDDPVRHELSAFQGKRAEYLARRPVFSHLEDMPPPWKDA